MFLDCATVLHFHSVRQALVLWRALWGGEALRGFRELIRQRLVHVKDDSVASNRFGIVAVSTVARQCAESILRGAPEVPDSLTSHAGSRVWQEYDYHEQAAGPIKGMLQVS